MFTVPDIDQLAYVVLSHKRGDTIFMAFFGRISWAGSCAESAPCMFDIPNEPSQHYGDNKVCLLRLFFVCLIFCFVLFFV